MDISATDRSVGFDEALQRRLAGYLAAVGAGASLTSTADGAVVANTTLQPFGINQHVNIDFNSDNLVDFQIDHDRVNVSGTNLDYLQLDKNDVNSATNPFPIDQGATFAPPPGVVRNTGHAYLQAQTAPTPTPPAPADDYYPAALNAGDVIGGTPPGMRSWIFQETANYGSDGVHRRHNRLLDEDRGQIDQVLGGQLVAPPTDVSEWSGLGGEIRYLGVRLDLNSTSTEQFSALWNGWIGVRITNEADATGEVVGYGYESTVNTPIAAGATGVTVGDGDFDNDGDVDGRDFLVWQRTVGQSAIPFTGADATGDGRVNGDDLALWRSEFGSAVVAVNPSNDVAGAPVPEPGSLLISGLGAVLMAAWCLMAQRGRRRSQNR